MAKKKTKQPESIRLKLAGERTLTELRDMLLLALAELEARPFELYKNCNFYVTPVVPTRETIDLNTITIEHPYPCAADELDE